MNDANSLIAALTDPAVRQIAQCGRVNSFAKNAMLIQEEAWGDTVLVILSGRVKVYVSDAEGRERVLAVYGPGEYVGEMSLNGQPRSASVVALESTQCSVVPHAAMREAIRNPDIALSLITRLIQRTRRAADSMKNLRRMDIHPLLGLAKPQSSGELS